MGNLLGGAVRNPIDQAREWGSTIDKAIDSREEREWQKERQRRDQDWQSREGSAGRGWATGERQGSERWRTSEREGSQDWATGEREGHEGWVSGENKADRSWNSAENRAREGWASGENRANRENTNWQNDLQRQLERWRQTGQWGHEKDIQGSGQEWASGENSADRTARRAAQERDISAGAAAQERDIQGRKQQAILNQELAGFRTPAALLGLNQAGQDKQYQPLTENLPSTSHDEARRTDEFGEAEILGDDTEWDNTSSQPFRNQRRLMDKGEGNMLGDDPNPRTQPTAPKNSSFLHGPRTKGEYVRPSEAPPPVPTRTNPSGNDMIGAQDEYRGASGLRMSDITNPKPRTPAYPDNPPAYQSIRRRGQVPRKTGIQAAFTKPFGGTKSSGWAIKSPMPTSTRT